MNRSIDGLPQTSSSHYLVYLLIFSAAFVVLLPYLSPMGGVLLRSGKKVDVVGKVKSGTSKKVSPSLSTYKSSTYTSLPSDDMMKQAYYSESKCEALEALVMDLQRVVQNEREKTLNLEGKVRVLQLSEGILRDKIQNLEDVNSQSRNDLYSSSTSSAEFGMRTTPQTGSKRENLDFLVHDLKDRTAALEMKVNKLQRSENILMDRIQKLEEKFEHIADCRQTNVCEILNERQEYNKID